MFSIEEFIIAVFCCVDDVLIEITQIYPIKRRGFAPSLRESEVLTMEIVVTTCNTNRSNLQSRHFQTRINCNYNYASARIKGLVQFW